eukprot:CAMPEP_0170843234 /NCGR_PEP_ID=MMETSP0734-20130129/6164_1 /TAXON_ID=186038 /ORGANISM="Fragilariopsis kerguelensis, Strain L26-C5" /LENGTH=560 /DNA_ID=CAMNT_0011211419 /DNA_START=36 /DNA_END=1718 /DNA_ORIENTATION=+
MATQNEEALPPRTMNKRQSMYIGSSYAPSVKICWYSPPRQLQKWGCDQISPHCDWGNIFFDLFYVAGFFNLGSILVYDPSMRGFLYYVGCFFPLFTLWHSKTWYDSKFGHHYDIYHKVFEVGYLLALATAVSNIRPTSMMAHPSNYINMFVFSIALTVGYAMNFLRYVECYFFGRGQRKNIKYEARHSMLSMILTLSFYLAAAIVSGIAYWNSDDQKDVVGALRALAEDGGEATCDSGITQMVPVLLTLGGSIVDELFKIVDTCFILDEKSCKENTIPPNIDFMIHREGEWIHLVLGESLLSLLINDADHDDFISVFYCGILTVTFLQMLHFRSQPHSPEEHAFSCDKNAGVLFTIIFFSYSAALVGVGAVYKLFLKSLDEDYGGGERRLPSLGDGNADYVFRWLASGGSDDGCSPSGDERIQNIAYLFGFFFAAIYIFIDVMLVAHNGLSRDSLAKGYRKVIFKEEVSKETGAVRQKLNIMGILFVAIPREGIVILLVALCFEVTSPAVLAVVGCVTAFLQVATSALSSIFFPVDDQKHDHHDDLHGVIDDDDDDEANA